MHEYSAKNLASHFSKPLSAEDLAALNDEIAAMARAGLPLDQGLKNLAKEMGSGQLRHVTAAIGADLASGKTLPEAMAASKGHLPPFYSALVAAGVRSGRLSDVLATVTAYARTMGELRATVIASLIYPAIILLMGFGIIGLWVWWVGPQFRMIFTSMKLNLPGITKAFFYIVDHSAFFIFLPLGLLFAGIVGWRIYSLRSESGRVAWAKLIYGIPLVGTLIRSARLEAFSDLFGILVDHHVPLPEAFSLAADASSDPLIRNSSERIVERLVSGKSLASSLNEQYLVPDFLAWMVGMGERSGRLGETLHQVAGFYRKQAESRAALLRNVLPAFAVIIIAVVLVTFIVAALIAPMVSLIQGLSGGNL
jgi:type II secretory pathway component PulF